MRGWETAQSAVLRFIAALDHLLAVHKPTDSLVIVSHASVLALYTAHLREITPTYEQWWKIAFAAIMAIDRASLRPVTPFLTAPYAGLPMP
jgi:broad specificity phosphatase PhoE